VQDGGRHHLGFSKDGNFRGGKGREGQNASSCQIFRRSVKPLLRYGDFSIFKDGGRRHLVLSKYANFRGGKGQDGPNASPSQISSRSVTLLLRYGDFSNFQDGSHRHVRFSKSGNFRDGRSRRPKCITEPNFESIGQTVAEIWRFLNFFKMAAVRHFGLVVNVFGPLTEGIWWSLSLCKIWLESTQYF